MVRKVKAESSQMAAKSKTKSTNTVAKSLKRQNSG